MTRSGSAIAQMPITRDGVAQHPANYVLCALRVSQHYCTVAPGVAVKLYGDRHTDAKHNRRCIRKLGSNPRAHASVTGTCAARRY